MRPTPRRSRCRSSSRSCDGDRCIGTETAPMQRPGANDVAVKATARRLAGPEPRRRAGPLCHAVSENGSLGPVGADRCGGQPCARRSGSPKGALQSGQSSSVARNHPRRLAERTEMIFLPGSPRRAFSPAMAMGLSDCVFFLVLPCSSPPPSGPPLPIPCSSFIPAPKRRLPLERRPTFSRLSPAPTGVPSASTP